MTWNQPYLETCCRAALHRLMLCGPAGRPTDAPTVMKDQACLARLIGMGLATPMPDGRVAATEAGAARHASEILRSGQR